MITLQSIISQIGTNVAILQGFSIIIISFSRHYLYFNEINEDPVVYKWQWHLDDIDISAELNTTTLIDTWVSFFKIFSGSVNRLNSTLVLRWRRSVNEGRFTPLEYDIQTLGLWYSWYSECVVWTDVNQWNHGYKRVMYSLVFKD